MLAAGSRAIDAGLGVHTTSTDLAGNTRYDDPGMPSRGGGYPAYVDIGAFERQTATISGDLAVTYVSSPSPVFLSAGDAFSVSWRVTNIGLQNLSGVWLDRVYLSRDRNISPDDLLLDTREHAGELNAGASYTDTYDGFATVGTGPRYLLVGTSATGGFVEPNLVNNLAASPRPLGIDVPIVEVGSSLSGTVTAGQWQYVRLDGAEGSTILLSLTGASGLKLCASRGVPPTLNDHDFVSDSARELRILNPADDTYYIGVYAPTSPAGSHAFTVSAANTSLAIRRVTPNVVGNTGTATVEIIGDNFHPDAQAQLIASDGTVIKADEYWQDASTLFATFYLAWMNAEPGQYDIRIINPDASQTTATTAVTVEPGEEPEFLADLRMPGMTRPGRIVTVSIAYTNRSSQDIAAPLLRLTANDEVAWDIPGFDDTLIANTCYIMALSSTGPANILRPGQTETIDLFVQVPLTSSGLSIDLDSLVPNVSSGSDYSVSWGWIGPLAEPISNTLGDTWGEYVQSLGQLAEAVRPYQGLIYSAERLSELAEGPRGAPSGAELYGDMILYLDQPSLLIYGPDGQWHYANEAASLFNPEKPTVLLVHGNQDSMGTTPWRNMAAALYWLSGTNDVNVLGFDWSCHAAFRIIIADPWDTSKYIPADALVCAAQLAELGVSASSLHVVGHSHGAHLAGMVCEYLKKNGHGTPMRLTALDASPEHTHAAGLSPRLIFTGVQEWLESLLEGWQWDVLDNVGGQGWGAAHGSARFVEFYKSSNGCSGITPWGHNNFLVVQDGDAWGDASWLPTTEHGVAVKWFTQTILEGDSCELGYWWTVDKWDAILNDLPGTQVVYPWLGLIRGMDTIECVVPVDKDFVGTSGSYWNYGTLWQDKGHTEMVKSLAAMVDFDIQGDLTATSYSDDSVWHAGGEGYLAFELCNCADNLSSSGAYPDINEAAQIGGRVVGFPGLFSQTYKAAIDNIYLSNNPELDTGDLLIGNHSHEFAVAPGKSWYSAFDVILPGWDEIVNSLGETTDHIYYLIVDVAGAYLGCDYEYELWSLDNVGVAPITVDPEETVTADAGSYEVYTVGPDETAFVRLDGSGSQPSDKIDVYEWDIVLADGTSLSRVGMTPTISMGSGTHSVSLTVTYRGNDGVLGTDDDLTDTDTTSVVVREDQDDDPFDHEDNDHTGSYTSYTPEDKFGPSGFDSAGTKAGQETRFIQPDRPLSYRIKFWNKEDAVVPTQDAIILDELDRNVFDLSTLEFIRIGFLGWDVALVSGQVIDTRIDCRPEMNVAVEIKAGLGMEIPGFANNADINENTLVWWFHCIDPLTGEWPEDPMAGFLPPYNPETGFEIGWVEFTVDPVVGLPTGTELANVAYVEFDFAGDIYDHPAPKVDPDAEPAEPDPWINTIDADAPESSVAALASTQYYNLFMINWSGTDVGSGIAAYDIYVCEDGGPWTRWLSNTVETIGWYTGRSGHSYGFYSVARDHVGNVESAPAALVPDAVTTIDEAVELELGSDVVLVEGDTFSLTAAVGNMVPGSTAAVNYGDGMGQEPLMLAEDGSFSLSRTYADDGVYVVVVSVSDPYGTTVSDILVPTQA